MAKIGNALKQLQEALPAIPMGSELHTAILETVKKLGKATQSEKPDPSMQLQELVRSLREAASGGPAAALSRLAPPAAGSPQAGGPALPPPSPPPSAALDRLAA